MLFLSLEFGADEWRTKVRYTSAIQQNLFGGFYGAGVRKRFRPGFLSSAGDLWGFVDSPEEFCIDTRSAKLVAHNKAFGLIGAGLRERFCPVFVPGVTSPLVLRRRRKTRSSRIAWHDRQLPRRTGRPGQ